LTTDGDTTIVVVENELMAIYRMGRYEGVEIDFLRACFRNAKDALEARA
jgi:hypothetical protein